MAQRTTQRITQKYDITARSLEDAFFLEQDQILVERLRRIRALAQTREALAEVSGIKNEAVLDRLLELGIKPEMTAALALVPLVELAWADGDVDDDERKAVLGAAEAGGIVRDSIEHQLLAQWLTHRPARELLDAWSNYVSSLCGRLGDAEREALRRELLDRAQAVAMASGGVLGLGKISAAERRVLQRIEESLC